MSRGLEKLLALATLSAEWRQKVLASPLEAAGEAKLELSESESAIVRAMPRDSLEGMIAQFERNLPRPRGLAKLAAAAAVALLIASLAGCGDPTSPATDGIRPDKPDKKQPDKEDKDKPKEPEAPKSWSWGHRSDIPTTR